MTNQPCRSITRHPRKNQRQSIVISQNAICILHLKPGGNLLISSALNNPLRSRDPRNVTRAITVLTRRQRDRRLAPSIASFAPDTGDGRVRDQGSTSLKTYFVFASCISAYPTIIQLKPTIASQVESTSLRFRALGNPFNSSKLTSPLRA